MKRFLVVCILVLFFVLGFKTLASKPSDFGLKEGDLISAIFSDDPDVYIINEHGYKRLFLNPEIFKFYTHLGGFANIKLVTPEIRDSFPTSGFFRNCEDNDQKVYGTSVEGEDSGRLHWINKSGDQAVQEDPEFFKKVFCINRKEFNWYPRGTEFKALKEVPQYHRTEEVENPVICHYPTDDPQLFQTIRVAPEALDAHFQHGDTKGACSTYVLPTLAPQPVPIPTSTPITSVAPTPILTPTLTASSSFSSTPTPILTPNPTASSSFTPTPTPVSTSSPQATPTPTTDTAEPSPPSLSVTAISSSEIRVSWSASTDNVGVVGYKIYRNGYLIATVGASVLSYSDTGLSPNTSYPYTVQAYDAAGNNSMMTFVSTQSATTFSATPTPTPTPTPSVLNSPSSVVASLGAGKISVVWSGGTAPTYKVFRCAASFGCGAGPAYSLLSVTSDTYYDDYVVDPGIVYRYKIYGCESNQTTCSTATESNDVTYSTSTLNPILKIAGTSKIIFPRDLFFGSSGSDVKQLQAMLVNEVGFSVNLVTGYFGSITRDAVKRLQEKYGIKPVSGYFGEITRGALKALISD